MLSNVKENLQIYEGGIELVDMTRIFRWINCRVLEIASLTSNSLTNAEVRSLIEVLTSRVEKFSYRNGCQPFFPYIEQYDGRGKCQEIELKYRVVANEGQI